MKTEATRDPEVIATWQRLATDSQRKFKLISPSLFVLAFVCLGLGIYLQNIFVAGLFFLFAFGAIAVNFAVRLSLVCPHCSRSPLNPFVLSSPLHENFCPHCLYWLKSPW